MSAIAADTELRWVGVEDPDREWLERQQHLVDWQARRVADAIVAETPSPWSIDDYREARDLLASAERIAEHLWKDGGRDARLPGWLLRKHELERLG